MKKDESKAFDWKNWKSGALPELAPHSAAKLKVLQDYVEEYITILCARSFGVEKFRITLIDGFSGGGSYQGGKQGSPFTLLRAVETAEAKLNLGGRTKRIEIDCECHFIDESKAAIECLHHEFEQSVYKNRIGKSVFLHKGSFESKCSDIIARLKKRHPKAGGRAIFFLDQCGYAQVNPNLLRKISHEIKHAEYIINFAIEWLSDFIGDSKEFRSRYETLGLQNLTTVEDLIRAKEQGGVNWKYLVESQIGPAFRKVAGSPFFSPFYIEPVTGHRGYWLLHLAPHERARSAMLDVYWKNANSHRHFGHAGLNMLAYKADADQTGYLDGMTFDDITRQTVKAKLGQDFARVIRDSHADGINFEEFAKSYSNQTMANNALMAEVLSELASEGELIITGPKGSAKRSLNVQNEDILLPCNQLQFLLSSKTKKK